MNFRTKFCTLPPVEDIKVKTVIVKTNVEDNTLTNLLFDLFSVLKYMMYLK